MLIVCPSCATQYRIPAHHIGENGRTMRCASCRETWFVPPDRQGLAVEAVTRHIEDTALDWYQPQSSDVSFPVRLRRNIGTFAGRLLAVFLSPLMRLSPALAPALALMILFGGSIGARERVVEILPQLGGLYSLAGFPVTVGGLNFRDVRSQIVLNGNEAILVVEGEIANLTAQEKDVPTISIHLKSAARQDVYQWTIEPPRRQMGAHENSRFRARLAAPPPEAQQVLVRFSETVPARLAAH
jgi:predicted Zn finger-like uncharacterized protein